MRIVKEMPTEGQFVAVWEDEHGGVCHWDIFIEDNSFCVIDGGLHYPLWKWSIEAIKAAEMFIIPEKQED